MAGKAVSYRLLDVLAKSVGRDAETIKQVLSEIKKLQTRMQALEEIVQGKAPTDTASKEATHGSNQ